MIIIYLYWTSSWDAIYHARLLHDADRSDRFATSISLREHAHEHYAAQNIW